MKITPTNKILFSVLILLTTISIVALAQNNPGPAQKQEPRLRLPLMKKAPVIDGTINADEWSGADQMQGFTHYQKGGLTPQHGEFWVGADAENLYIAVRSETPLGGKLLARANPMPHGTNSSSVFLDDCIEVRVVPNPDAPTAERHLYLGLFNAKGAVSDRVSTLRGGVKWHGNWRVKNSITDDHWDCEIALPWKDIGVDSPSGKTMAVRIGRDWRQAVGADQSDWGLGKTPFADVSSMPHITWDAAAPVVQTLQLQDAPNSKVNIKVRIFNPGTTALKTDLNVNVEPAGSAQNNYRKVLNIAPGQNQVLTIKADATPNETIFTHIEATSSDGKTIYYLRDFTWQINRPEVLWNLNPEAAKRAHLNFAYFPSYNAVHVQADLSNLPNHDDVKGIELTIRKKGATKPIAQTAMPPVKNDRSEIARWNIPSLPEGNYELVAQLQGIAAKPIIKEFVRHHFAWEGNKLGKSDIVVPPFTPINVKDDEVDVILRKHQMNGVGLWNQVMADGKPLLKAPMRLEATIGGKVLLAQGQLKVLSQKPTQAITKANWQAGALKGSTQNVWDYDGVMKSTFTLQPTKQKVDSLTLVIPLDNAMMPLMHAVTFGGHHNYAGDIKAGTGIVWQSEQAPSNSFIGTYVPYLWMGAQERGLAVFGDNDAGWITDDKSSCQEIVRKPDGTLELRLRLIQHPAQWDKPREITIGFQATPAKPMPKDWRLWTVYVGGGAPSHTTVPGLLQQYFMATTSYWGSVTGAGAIYPDDGNLSLWDEYAKARKTGKYDSTFLTKWSDLAYAKLDTKAQAYRKNVTTSMMNRMAAQPQNVLIYTDARGMRPDTPAGQTFINEWNRKAFPQREWEYASNISYDVDPVQSYRDMRAWYYQKSLSTFSDAIYWDVVSLGANYNLLTSNAYVRPDGQVQPSTGLWNIRALVKRGAVLADEMGKTNRNMVHMSGTNIVPINDFSATQADWELKYGAGDFQDKFPRDYIQAQSIGRQAGLVPIVILNQKFIVGNKQEAAWQYRTAAGVMLTHELKPWWMRGYWAKPDPFWTNYDKLLEFGYGQPDTKVYNYWETTFPAEISGQMSSLIVSKPGSAILVLCDYGNGGDFTIKLDIKVLSLTGILTATNIETGQVLPVTGNTFTVNLKKHDFEVIQIEGKK